MQMPLNVISLFKFPEDWGFQEQCKWYSIPEAFDTPWVTEALKVKALLPWTLEFKISLTPWEVSTIRFCPFINLKALVDTVFDVEIGEGL